MLHCMSPLLTQSGHKSAQGPTPSRALAQIATITCLASGATMRRRQFIRFVGGAVAAWPLAVQGQQGERMRLIGVLLPVGKDDQFYLSLVTAFRQALQELGLV